MLKENRIIFFILLVLLNIFIIYIICKNIKYYEEEFTQMIKVHYQEQPISTGQSDLENQSLYNFDFASDPLIINNDFVKVKSKFFSFALTCKVLLNFL